MAKQQRAQSDQLYLGNRDVVKKRENRNEQNERTEYLQSFQSIHLYA